MSTAPELEPTQVAQLGERLRDNIARAVKAPSDVIRDVLVALFAEGHVLNEDYPGVGKTALARALARSVDAEYARIQATADLLPSDVVGTNVFNQREGRFEFRPGPVFANIVLVDYEGTYPLPEAQLDRFMVRVSLGYPGADAEVEMLSEHSRGDRVLELEH